jgi:hypothetical protein
MPRGPAALVLCLALAAASPAAGLPRFTEEREVAALHFIRKHSAELLPLLEELQRTQRPRYEQQIRETFQLTELLADLQDQPKRYELELKVWKTENRAFLLVARYGRLNPSERKEAEARLRELARELAELDVQSLELQAEELESELGSVRDEIARGRGSLDRRARERADAWLDQARKARK